MRNMIDEANLNKIKTARITFRNNKELEDTSKDSKIWYSTNSTVSNNTKESKTKLDPITNLIK